MSAEMREMLNLDRDRILFEAKKMGVEEFRNKLEDMLDRSEM
jgi:hypothetical protein